MKIAGRFSRASLPGRLFRCAALLACAVPLQAAELCRFMDARPRDLLPGECPYICPSGKEYRLPATGRGENAFCAPVQWIVPLYGKGQRKRSYGALSFSKLRQIYRQAGRPEPGDLEGWRAGVAFFSDKPHEFGALMAGRKERLPDSAEALMLAQITDLDSAAFEGLDSAGQGELDALDLKLSGSAGRGVSFSGREAVYETPSARHGLRRTAQGMIVVYSAYRDAGTGVPLREGYAVYPRKIFNPLLAEPMDATNVEEEK